MNISENKKVDNYYESVWFQVFENNPPLPNEKPLFLWKAVVKNIKKGWEVEPKVDYRKTP